MVKYYSIIAFIIGMMVFNVEDDIMPIEQTPVYTIDSMALVALYIETNGQSWTQTWDLNSPIANWHGVSLRIDTNGTRVSEINLENNNLRGNIPKEIGNLTALRILRLQRNHIDGFLPDEIVHLINLEELFLFENSISGSLPDSLGQLSKVRMLSMARNELNGSIPPSIGKMKELRQLVLDQNKLSGILPNSLTQLSNLTFLDLHNNDLEGHLPDSLNNLSNIEEFLIHDNKIEGPIPTSMSELEHMTHFWANNNKLTGTVPDFGRVPLISLRLAQNNITNLGDLFSIQTLGVNHPDGITAELNQLSYDDIIFHLDLIDSINFLYTPQKEIQLEDTVLVRSGDPWIYQLPFDDTITTSSYKWFKNDQIVELTNDNRFIISSVSKSDEGLYHCTVANRIISEMDLTTSKIRLIVKESSDCGNPPPSDECFLTNVLCGLGELDDYCNDMDSLSNQERLSFCDHNFTLLDRDWFSFIAGEKDIRIRITPYNCSSNQNGGLIAWVFDNCNLGTPLNCDTICQRSTFEIALSDLQIGQTYNLLIGGCSGICSYELDVRLGGSSLSLERPDQIIGENNICQINNSYTYNLASPVRGASNYHWTITHPDTTFSVFDSMLNIQWPFSGDYELCVQAINDCDTSLYKCQNIQVYPSIEISELDTDIFSDEGVYSVHFKINGGKSPYTIEGATGTYNALEQTFTSDTISCGEGYFITVSDVNFCEVVLSGVEHCNCISYAGEMSTALIETCEFSAFRAQHLGGEVLDTNDIALYIFHESTGNGQLGNIIDINNTGIFRFNDQLMFLDTSYYVSYAVGNKLNGGGLQFNDPCLSLSNSQEVVFHKEPIANAGPDQQICFGDFVLEAIKSDPKSTGNWQFIDGPKRPDISQPNSSTTSVTIDTHGIYLFRWLEINDGCIGSDSIKVVVRPTINAKIEGVDALCNGIDTKLSVADSFVSYLWSTGETTASIIVDEPGLYSVTVKDDLNCTATSSKEIFDEESPVVVIEGDNKICEGDLFELAAHQEFASYRWSTGDSTRSIVTEIEGVICVTITDDKGCLGDDCVVTKYKSPSNRFIEATICHGDSLVIHNQTINVAGHYEILIRGANREGCDSTVVLNLNIHPEIFIVDSLIIHDDGSGNGAISVSIEGGKRPYSYLWSNGATSQFISQLNGGKYKLSVTDANECTQEFVFEVKSKVATKKIISHSWNLDISPTIMTDQDIMRIVGKSELPMDISLYFFNMQQQLKGSQSIQLNKQERSFSFEGKLEPGLHFVLIKHQNKTIKILKLMIMD